MERFEMTKLLSKAAQDDAAIQLLMSEVLREPAPVSRRQFLKLVGLAGGGLAVAFYLGDSQSALAQNATGSEPDFKPNGFVQISSNGDIVIFSKCPEIGQGIKTAFGLIIAEELDADWERVEVKQAAVNPAVYGRQGAGGSTSIPSNWDQLRQAGAMARSMLVPTAAPKIAK
jgi:isoquinoline 1-oxidoreductase beta subunit